MSEVGVGPFSALRQEREHLREAFLAVGLNSEVLKAIQDNVRLVEQHGYVWLRGTLEAAQAVIQLLEEKGIIPPESGSEERA